MHIIIGMPPLIIMTGMPAPIIVIMRWQHSLNMSIDMPSLGMTLHIMPLAVISHDIFIIGTGMPDIIGIMPLPIIGIMLPIIGMPPIIGFIMGIMPPIIPIMGFIMGFIIIGFIIIGIMPPIIGMLAGVLVGIGIAVDIVGFSSLRWSFEAQEPSQGSRA